MNAIWLRFTMKSDAAFGSGSGTPGLIDQEILVDESGLPYLHGRTLKGLLNEVCADILYASEAAQSPWKDVADSLFGKPGSDESARGVLMVGHAQLPESLRVLLQREVQQGNWDREVVFDSLTTVREQTAMNPDGSPEEKSLRTTRLILRETPFEALLDFARPLTDMEKGLLAACAKGFRRAGTARNRGRGRLQAALETDDGTPVTDDWFSYFKQEVLAS